jgi:hypothetical protein
MVICEKSVQRPTELISQIHAINYYHEFDLVNGNGILLRMGIPFDITDRSCAQNGSGAVSRVRGLFHFVARAGSTRRLTPLLSVMSGSRL